MTAGVYAIRNIVNGRRYIGQSENIELRVGQHLHDLRDEAMVCARNPKRLQYVRLFVKDWMKHEQEDFEVDVLEIVMDKQRRVERERWYILNTPCEYNVSIKKCQLKINYPVEENEQAAG